MEQSYRFKSYKVLGVNITAASIKDAVAAIIAHGTDGRRPATYVVKPYVEFMDRATHDPDFRRVLNSAEMTLPDGIALLWAAHFLYGGRRTFPRFIGTLASIILRPAALTNPLPERIAGTNFTWPLLEAAECAGATIFLIGDVPDGIDSVAKTIRHRLPRIKIVGALCGRDRTMPPRQVSDAWLTSARDALLAADPDITLVGMGFPLQEHVMARLAPELRHGVLIGEGGTFDFRSFGGKRPKAPVWMQRLGLEWLWRLILQPSRIRRQLAIPRFIWEVWRSR